MRALTVLVVAGLVAPDAVRLIVENVQPSGTIEPHPSHVSELLPIRARHRSDPVELLEVGDQLAVLPGEVDGLLGGCRAGRQQGGQQENPFNQSHIRLHLHGWFLLWID